MTESLYFAPSEPLTLGVEIELQLLDQETLDLTPKSPEVLARLTNLGDRVKAEIFQSMIELNTKICRNADEVRVDLSETMKAVDEVAKELGIRIASTGTHPFARYSDRILYPAARYVELIDRNQWIARRLMIFGMHVHVGMRNGEHAIQMTNALLHYLPMLLALSSSSPYWHAEDTELASSRITFFEALPTGGHPCEVKSWDDFTDLYAKLFNCGAIRSPKDLWWDIRPSPEFGTIEFRICDGLATLDETVALTAFIHSLCIFVDRQLSEGRIFSPPPDWIMRENKWRASRWGLDTRLIVNSNGDTEDLRELIKQLIVRLRPVVRDLNYESEFLFLKDLLIKGTSSQRQRAFASGKNQDYRAITDFNAREFDARTPLWNTYE